MIQSWLKEEKEKRSLSLSTKNPIQERVGINHQGFLVCKRKTKLMRSQVPPREGSIIIGSHKLRATVQRNYSWK